MTLTQARQATGGIGAASPMPGRTFGLPAQECKRGAVLQQVRGSRCFKCYAERGHYLYQNVQLSQRRRLERLRHPLWIPAMVTLIDWAVREDGEPYFRWHDSGDLQGVWHLRRIVRVCVETPGVWHWLPTGEPDMIRGYEVEYGALERVGNLVVRLSGDIVDRRPPSWWPWTASVYTEEPLEGSLRCTKRDRSPQACGPCRACWDKEVEHVGYKQH